MILSHQKKFIFIHNYKVAGSSIKKSLGKYNDLDRPSITTQIISLLKQYPKFNTEHLDDHINAKELKSILPGDIFTTYFKFGFVRNPWDWQVSLYNFMLIEKEHHQHDVVKSLKNFDEYIDWRVHNDLHFQKDFFYENDECLMDFIGKLEDLTEDFQKACKTINVRARLPHINLSREDNKHYLNFYSERSFELVKEAFKEDLDTFDYDAEVELKKYLSLHG